MKKKLTEKRKAQMKAWRDANKETIAIKKKALYEANKESLAIKRKADYEANKEARLIKQKTYNKANKEAIAIQRKAHYQANKESIAIRDKIRYEANKESIAIQNKTNYETKRLPHHIVYCLPHYNKHGYVKYAGVTDNPYYRMRVHKYDGNNTDEWFVLQVCETREEAFKIEREYHKKGYAGGQHHNKSKK